MAATLIAAMRVAGYELLDGRTVAMLAVNGDYPLAALRALADDEHFAGIVIVGVDARGLSKQRWDMQQPWIAHYRDRWLRAPDATAGGGRGRIVG